MRCVNCGCGNKYVISDDWINLDFVEREGVQKCNILEGMPFESDSVDVVFSCCMLEHFTIEQANKHIEECYRILKAGGF